MRLKGRFDEGGVLWFANPAVTYQRWFQKYYTRRKAPMLSPVGILSLLLAVLLTVVSLAPGVRPRPLDDPLLWFFVVTSILLAAYDAYRQRHPFYHPSAPARVGFTRMGIRWESADGSASARAWTEIFEVELTRDPAGGLQATLAGPSPLALRSLQPDLAIKIHWAARLSRRGNLDPADLTRPVPPTGVWKRAPGGGTVLTEAHPTVVVYPDRFMVFRWGRLHEFRRSDVDAFGYSESGEKWLVVIVGDRHPARIFLPNAGRFLEWLGGTSG